MNRRVGKHVSRLFRRARQFFRTESGVAALEYAILTGVVATVIVTAIVALGDEIKGLLEQVGTNLNATQTNITP